MRTVWQNIGGMTSSFSGQWKRSQQDDINHRTTTFYWRWGIVRAWDEYLSNKWRKNNAKNKEERKEFLAWDFLAWYFYPYSPNSNGWWGAFTFVFFIKTWLVHAVVEPRDYTSSPGGDSNRARCSCKINR